MMNDLKQIWNSKCKYLIMIACSLIIMNGINLLHTSLKFVNENGEEADEIKSVKMESDDWDSKGPGSFQVTKSADWTDIKKATIKFDVETNSLTGHKSRDIILVLDKSGSMKSKNKLGQLQSDMRELINFLLTEEGTRIAIIGFSSQATLLSEFTSDSNELIQIINGLVPAGETSYKRAYQEVINLLSSYEQDSNRSLVMMFLTDGGAPAASAEYSILKGKYNIQIYGIQYELGTNIKPSIVGSSDAQYIADVTNLKDVLFEVIGVTAYEEFEITDYISNEFYVNNVSDIRVSRGNVRLETMPDGTQKVIWNLATGDSPFLTSFSATMEIDVIFKGETDAGKVYKTNKMVEIGTKLPGGEKENQISGETPRIRGGYYVNYNPNLPSDCSYEKFDFPTQTSYFAQEIVNISDKNYTCLGWQFKGWKLPEDITPLGDDKFIMPSEDITLTAIWTKLELTKAMDGTIATPVEQLRILMIENEGTDVKIDSSINFGNASSASNGRGLYIRSGTQNDTNPIYYYRGNVSNNHVLFAGICWQIVRTTETGGVKLIYNGVSSDGKSCVNTGNTYIGTSPFNSRASSPAYVGYMYGSTIYTFTKTNAATTQYYFGKSVNYSGGAYTLSLTTRGSESGYNYTCNQTIASRTCSTVYYFYYISARGTGYEKYYLSLSGGDKLETAMSKMNTNSQHSSVKSTIDSWYKTNINAKGYTKYLEDAVWCNDRKLTSGGLSSEGASYGNSYYASIDTRNLIYTSANPAVKESVACQNANDRFTVSASTGNKSLTYSVGMLTADEVVLAGIGYGSSKASTDSYLSKNYSYWTMTPKMLGYEEVENFYVGSGGFFSGATASTSYNIRPSISLRAGTLVSAGGGTNGTKEHPYVVVME